MRFQTTFGQSKGRLKANVKQPVDHIRRLHSLSQKTNGESNHEQQHPSRTEIRCQPRMAAP